MKIHSGMKRTLLDKRDRSFHRTFGTVLPHDLPDEYNVDAGLTMPDQNAEGNPYSCTAYTTCDLGTDQDEVMYAPEYTYMKTLFMQGLPPETNGSDIRPSLKSGRVYGLLPKLSMPVGLYGKGEDYTADQAHWPAYTDEIAGKMEHRKAGYFNVYEDGGLDWFDGMRSAMWLNRIDKRGISVGTPWFAEWAGVAAHGILSEHVFFNDWLPWHNWAIKGWTKKNEKGETINGGEIFLKCKAWAGPNYGDKGWVYISRATINKVMEIRGSVAYTLKDADVSDIRTIKLSMLEYVLIYLYRLVGKARYA